MNDTSTKGAALAGALVMVVVLVAAAIAYGLTHADADPARPAAAKRTVAEHVPAPTTSTTPVPAPTASTTALPPTHAAETPVAARKGDDRVVEERPPTPQPQPQPQPQPRPRSNQVASSPASGPAGSTIYLSASDSCGTGSSAGTVDLSIRDPHGRVMASRRFAANGSWSAAITLPSSAVAGEYRINASCVEGDIARVLDQNRFTVTAPTHPRFSMDRTTVAPGGDVTVSSIDGCASAQAVQVTLVDSKGVHRGSAAAKVDQSGGWGATLPVHATTPNGSFTVQATCTTPTQVVRYVPQALQVSGPTAVH